MRCPICQEVQLVIASREGIEIDHCPQCRGVWLDRGELDKIIDRAAPSVVGAGRPPEPAPAAYRDERPSDDRDRPRYDDRPRDDRDRPRYDDRPRDDRPRYDDRDDRYRSEQKRKKKRSFLEDIFDFD